MNLGLAFSSSEREITSGELGSLMTDAEFLSSKRDFRFISASSRLLCKASGEIGGFFNPAPADWVLALGRGDFEDKEFRELVE